MITTNEAYWDCICEGLPEEYIQSKKLDKCPRCNTVARDQPDAHSSEINDRVIYFANLRIGIIDETRCYSCSREFAVDERPSLIQTSSGVFSVCEDEMACERIQNRNSGFLQNLCSNCGIVAHDTWSYGLSSGQELCPDSAACGYRKFIRERHNGNLDPIFWGPIPMWMVG